MTANVTNMRVNMDDMTANMDNDTVDCPVYGENSAYVVEWVKFWVEGVALSAVAVMGVAGNALSSLVLSRHELRNPFNLLLIGLAFFDTVYIVCSLLYSVHRCFYAASQLQLLLTPLLLFPGLNIAMTGSVLMIVAIAFERYVSVHHPLDYNQAINDPTEIRKRLLKYFVPVAFLSVLMNVPKFFETRTELVQIENGTNMEQDEFWSSPGYTIKLNMTDMRTDPVYSSFMNSSQLIVLGIIPVCLLVYFNYKIYQDIRERERRRRPLTQRDLAAVARATAPSVAAAEGTRTSAEAAAASQDEADTDDAKDHLSVLSRIHVVYQRTSSRLVSLTFRRGGRSCLSRPSSPDPSSTSSLSAMPPLLRPTAPGDSAASSTGMSNSRRRRVEDRLAILFMGIVAVYLCCHLPRILLNFYEILVIEKAMKCIREKKVGFAPWAMVLTSVSHLLLVTNSSINILIYSLFNSQFRKAAANLFDECCCCCFDGDGKPARRRRRRRHLAASAVGAISSSGVISSSSVEGGGGGGGVGGGGGNLVRCCTPGRGGRRKPRLKSTVVKSPPPELQVELTQAEVCHLRQPHQAIELTEGMSSLRAPSTQNSVTNGVSNTCAKDAQQNNDINENEKSENDIQTVNKLCFSTSV